LRDARGLDASRCRACLGWIPHFSNAGKFDSMDFFYERAK
jgi:hypothetical protein